MLIGVCPFVYADAPTQTVIEPVADYHMNNTSGRPSWANNGWLQIIASATNPAHTTHGIGLVGYDVSGIFDTLSANPDYIVKSVKFKPYMGYYKSGATDLTINMYVVNSDWRDAVAADSYNKSFLPGYVADSGDTIAYPQFGTPDLSFETDIDSSSNYAQKKVDSMYYRSAEMKEYDITNLFHLHKANNFGKENQNFFTFAFDLTTKSGTRTELHIPSLENVDGVGGCFYHTPKGYADLSELAPAAAIEVEYMKLSGLNEKSAPEIPVRPGDDLKISYNTPIENVKCSIVEVGTNEIYDLSDGIQISGADISVSFDFEPLKSYVADITVSDIYGQTLGKSYVITMERDAVDTVLSMNTNGGNFHDAAFLSQGGDAIYSLNASKNVYYENGSNPNAFVMFKIPLQTPDEGGYLEKAVFRYTSDYASPASSQRIFKFPGEDWHISIGDTSTVYDDEIAAIMSDYEANKAGECYAVEEAGSNYHYLVDVTEYVNECIEAGQSSIYLGVTAEKTTAKVFVRGTTKQDITYTIVKNPVIGFAGKQAVIDGETLTEFSFDVLSTFDKDVLESAITLEDGSGNIVEEAVFEYESAKVALSSPVELTSGESYKVIIKEGTEDVFGNSVTESQSVIYEFGLDCDDVSSKDVLRVKYNSKTSEVSVLYVSPYYHNHDVTVNVINTADDSIHYTNSAKTDQNGVLSLENIEVRNEGGYVVSVVPAYGAKSGADVLNSGYTSYLWSIAAFSTDALEILEYLDLLIEAFGVDVGYKEYISDFYDFCFKLSDTRDNYQIGQQNAENLSKLKSAFETVGLLTAAEEISEKTSDEEAKALYDALLLSVDDAEFREKLIKTEDENKDLFEAIYSDFISSEKSFKSVDDFKVLIEKIYNENKQSIILAMFKELSHISQTDGLLTDSDTVSVLGIKELIEKYEELESKTIVHEAVYKKEFETVEAFVQTLEDAIDEALTEDEDDEPRKTNKGSGASGGKGSSGSLAIGSGVVTSEPAVSGTSFNDLGGYEWAKAQIDFLCKKAVINGKGDGIFDPSGNVLREEAVKMIVEAFDISATGTNTVFDDVPASAWYAGYVQTANNAGITKGISENLFGAGFSITRQDAAVMIYKALVKKGTVSGTGSFVLEFSDGADVADYARDAVGYMNSVGTITGYADGSFKPEKTISRAEFAVVMGRICRLIEG